MSTPEPVTATREDVRIAWLAALATGIHALEAQLPSPVPGIKPGLANVITVFAVCRYGWRVAAWVAILRVFAASLLLGNFLSPGFLLALAGASAAVAALGLGRLLPGTGALGYSVLAACAHMTGQFLLAWGLLIPHPALPYLFPWLMTAALVFGVVNGIIAGAVLRRTRGHGRASSYAADEISDGIE
ncbi:Gx transporter family protein [Arhodomonas sp. SL1]|uniref:Gx transporter family protein n=1 Tax=Arhodomonas sp. SL1 TaxID=3425691 RepID=UPI003F883B59